MPGIDLTTAETKLSLWLDAETKIAAGQRIAVEGHDLTRADLRQVREQIDYWQRWVTRLSARATRAPLQRAIFRG